MQTEDPEQVEQMVATAEMVQMSHPFQWVGKAFSMELPVARGELVPVARVVVDIVEAEADAGMVVGVQAQLTLAQTR